MDMYQKRKQRQTKKEEQGVGQNQIKTNINWDSGAYRQLY